jgi:hypothetical protein
MSAIDKVVDEGVKWVVSNPEKAVQVASVVMGGAIEVSKKVVEVVEDAFSVVVKAAFQPPTTVMI